MLPQMEIQIGELSEIRPKIEAFIRLVGIFDVGKVGYVRDSLGLWKQHECS